MIILGFARNTVRAMREVFANKVCLDCGQPAERLFIRRNSNGDGENGDYFYCHECYDPKPQDTIEFTEKRVVTHKHYHPKIKRISDV